MSAYKNRSVKIFFNYPKPIDLMDLSDDFRDIIIQVDLTFSLRMLCVLYVSLKLRFLVEFLFLDLIQCSKQWFESPDVYNIAN